MNNLFRITKDNVDNYLHEYNKYKKNKIIKNTQVPNNKNNKKELIKIKTQAQPISIFDKVDINEFIKSAQYNKFNQPVHLMQHTLQKEQVKQEEQTKQIQPNTINNNNYKNIQNILNEKKYFNCEIKNNNPNNINKLIEKNNISNLINKNYESDDKNKIIFEYGKSGIKLDKLKKSMSKNLKILNKIDEMIRNFLDFNPKLKLFTLIKDELENQNETNAQKIHWNNMGQIIIESNKYFNIEFNEKNKKYNLVDFGYIKIFDINFTNEFVLKHRIPTIDSIISFSDNIRHFLKLIKLLEYTNKYKIKINQLKINNYDKTNLIDIIYQNLPEILINISEKKNIFNSLDKKFTFYFKITMEKTIGFILDKKDKLLHYFSSIENNESGYVFFYTVEIDSDYKIINLNRIKKQNKQIIKNNSSISNFTDFTDFTNSENVIYTQVQI